MSEGFEKLARGEGLHRTRKAFLASLKRLGEGTRKLARKATPRVTRGAKVTGLLTARLAAEAATRSTTGLTAIQFATLRRLEAKLDRAEELTPSEQRAYDRLVEKRRRFREALRAKRQIAKRGLKRLFA